MIPQGAETMPLSLDELQLFASNWCPDCYTAFQITMDEDIVCFCVYDWMCRKTISELCTLQVDGRTIPKRLAMELNVGNLFDQMQAIWEEHRKEMV